VGWLHPRVYIVVMVLANRRGGWSVVDANHHHVFRRHFVGALHKCILPTPESGKYNANSRGMQMHPVFVAFGLPH
jgi:hypothetical protein